MEAGVVIDLLSLIELSEVRHDARAAIPQQTSSQIRTSERTRAAFGVAS